MYLQRIKLENWGPISDSIELAELSAGLNVIHGPNEAGKSTIMDAICRGFFDKHRTSSIKNRQPWGTSLGPAIEIDFAIGGQQWRLRKQFVEDQGCALHRWSGGKWEKIAQGQTADEQVVGLVSGRLAGAGLTKAEHWGLGQVLWACQGEATCIQVGESQQSRLREALKITLDSKPGTAVETLIGGWYDATYTSSGKMKGGQNRAEVLELQEQLETASGAVNMLQGRLLELEQLSHDLDSCEGDQEAAKRELEIEEAELARKRQRLEELRAEQRLYDNLVAAKNQTQTEWERQNKHVNDINEADRAVVATAAQAENCKSAVERAAAAAKAAKQLTDRAVNDRDARRRDLNAAEEAVTNADRGVRFVEARQELEEKKRRFKQVQDLEAKIAGTQKELASLRAPTQSQIKSLRKVAQDLAEKKAQLDVVSLSVTLGPSRKISVTPEIDGKPQSRASFQSAKQYKAISTMSLDIDGVARVSIRAGESNADSLLGELEKLQRKWKEAVCGFAADEINLLEALASRRTQVEERIEQLREQRPEDQAAAELSEEIEKLQSSTKAYLDEDPSLAKLKEAPEEVRHLLKELKSAQKHAKKQADDAQEHLDSVQNEQKRVDKAAAGESTQQAITGELLKDRRDQAAKLRASDGITDEARAAALAAALLKMDAARQRLDATPKPPVEDITHEIAQLDETVKNLQTGLNKLAMKIGGLRTRVQQAGGEGLYSQLAEATERQEQVTEALARARLDAEAIKVLWEMLQKKKAEVFEAVLQPIRVIVTSEMQRIVGPRYERLEFDESLRPTRVRPSHQNEDAEVDELSFGTREQLMLLVRLALGRLLSRSIGRQCVILDDPLVNADRSRQRAALRVIEEAAAETQIIIFTCHPNAYDGLSSVKRYDLGAMSSDVAARALPS